MTFSYLVSLNYIRTYPFYFPSPVYLLTIPSHSITLTTAVAVLIRKDLEKMVDRGQVRYRFACPRVRRAHNTQTKENRPTRGVS